MVRGCGRKRMKPRHSLSTNDPDQLHGHCNWMALTPGCALRCNAAKSATVADKDALSVGVPCCHHVSWLVVLQHGYLKRVLHERNVDICRGSTHRASAAD